jgi:transposase-like protein
MEEKQEKEPKEQKPPCRYCGQTAAVVRAGLNNKGGNQRHRCQRCRKYFTQQHWPKGHDPHLREQALRMYLEGVSELARDRQNTGCGVHHQSVANWIKAAADALPQQVADNTPTKIVEVDELFTYVGKKSNASRGKESEAVTEGKVT